MKNIVLIGYGNIARKHLEVFRALGGSISACCNRSAAKRLLAQKEGQIGKTYDDFHLMIKEQSPDGILVCASFWEMFSVLKQIIPYGIPVLTEKPTALSLDDHLQLVELAARFNTPVMVGLNRRHYSVINKAVTLGGGLDKITSVNIEWSENPTHMIKNRGFTDDQIRSCIFGNSIHGIDLLCWLGGSLTNPSIESISNGYPFRWLMTATGKSSRGTLSQFYSNWDCPIPWRVSFCTSDYNFVFAPLEKCKVFSPDPAKMIEIEPDPCDLQFKAGFFTQAKKFLSLDFADCTLEAITPTMELVDYISKSVNSKLQK